MKKAPANFLIVRGQEVAVLVFRAGKKGLNFLFCSFLIQDNGCRFGTLQQSIVTAFKISRPDRISHAILSTPKAKTARLMHELTPHTLDNNFYVNADFGNLASDLRHAI